MHGHSLRLPPFRARVKRRLFLVLTVATLSVGAWSGTALADTFTVTSSSDDPGAQCPAVIAHPCTLRAAITASNAKTPGPNVIDFAIPVATPPYTISPTSALPTVTVPVTIDGTSQPDFAGAPIVRLDGSSAQFVNGLTITAGQSTVRGLQVTNWAFETGIDLSGNSNVIAGDYIGTDGTAALANTTGVMVEPGSSNNTLGGTTTADRNVISGNSGYGIEIGSSGGATSDNLIEGNYVGTNAAGSAPVTGAQGNGGGIHIAGDADTTTIGGTTAAARNVISGNDFIAGITVDGSGTLIKGNYIGTDPTGVSGGNLGNGFGVRINSSNNTVGGTSSGAGNTIAGNGEGIYIHSQTTPAGSANVVQGNTIRQSFVGIDIYGNATNDTIGGSSPAAANQIDDNVGDGIQMTGDPSVHLIPTMNQIEGNSISDNTQNGVSLAYDSQQQIVNNTINRNLTGINYHTTPGLQQGWLSNDAITSNLISGNGESGVSITGSTGVNVTGNLIGTTPDGKHVSSGNGDGIFVGGLSTQDVIGGTKAADRNVISGNVRNGVDISGRRATNNTVENDYIGTDISGTHALANQGDGVLIRDEASQNTIGASQFATGGNCPPLCVSDLISGNGLAGVEISGKGTTGNLLEGDYIGTDVKSAHAVGNKGDGVSIRDGAADNRIDLDVIAGNVAEGIGMTDPGTSGNVIARDNVGVGEPQAGHPAGPSVPNLTGGIFFGDGASFNTVGDTSPGENLIRNNRYFGIEVHGSNTRGDRILGGSSISANHRVGISLTAGGNGREAPPRITKITTTSTSTRISGKVGAGAHTIDAFENLSCADPEGLIPLGVAHTSNGKWTLKVNRALPHGHGVTATSTRISTKNTSRFSGCKLV